jgi:hypothetical protein
MDDKKERQVLGKLIWREQLRAKEPDLKDKAKLKASWEKDRKEYIKLASRVLRRAEKRGFSVDISVAK